jgi:hypothetical protein
VVLKIKKSFSKGLNIRHFQKGAIDRLCTGWFD